MQILLIWKVYTVHKWNKHIWRRSWELLKGWCHSHFTNLISTNKKSKKSFKPILIVKKQIRLQNIGAAKLLLHFFFFGSILNCYLYTYICFNYRYSDSCRSSLLLEAIVISSPLIIYIDFNIDIYKESHTEYKQCYIGSNREKSYIATATRTNS